MDNIDMQHCAVTTTSNLAEDNDEVSVNTGRSIVKASNTAGGRQVTVSGCVCHFMSWLAHTHRTRDHHYGVGLLLYFEI